MSQQKNHQMADKGRNLLHLFDQHEWQDVIQIEQDMVEYWKRAFTRLPAKGESNEEFLNKIIAAQARIEAMNSIWLARHSCMEAAKKIDDQEEDEENG